MTRRRKLFLSFILIIAIILVALPEAGRFYVIGKITEQGFDNVTIEDVDLNLFTGVLEIKNVRVGVAGEDKLVIGLMRADYRWQGLFSGGIETELVEIKDTKLAVIEDDDGGFEVVIPILAEAQQEQVDSAEAELTPELKPELEPEQGLKLPNLDVDLVRLENIEVDINVRQFSGRYVIEQFSLTRVSTWHDYPAELTLVSKLNDTSINAKLTANPLAVTPSVQGDVTLKNINFNDFKTLTNLYSPIAVDVLEGKTDINFYVDGLRDTDNLLYLNFKGDLNTSDVHVTSKAVALKLDSLAPSYSITYQQLPESAVVSGSVDAKLTGFSVVDEQVNASAAGNANESNLLVGFEQFNITQLEIDEDSALKIDAIEFANLSWFSKNQGAVSSDDEVKSHAKVEVTNTLDKLRIEQVALAKQSTQTSKTLSFNHIAMAGLTTSMQLDEQNQLNWLTMLEPVQQRFIVDDKKAEVSAAVYKDTDKETDETNPAENSESPLAIEVNSFDLAAPAFIHVTKTLNGHRHNLQFDISKLALENIATNESESDAKRSKFALTTKLNKTALIDVSGDGVFNKAPIDINAAGKIEDMSLVTLSPFIEQFAGYQFVRGQFDHQFNLALKNNKIDMTNEVEIRKLQVKDIDESKVVSTLPIPMAITVLEDDKGVIDIEIPVKGSLDDSEGGTDVNINSLIQKSITQAVKKGSVGFLKYALQPYGAAFMAAEYLVDAANQIAFDDMVFAVNSAELAAKQLDYANKLVDVLKQRDEIDLQLCGESNLADKTALEINYQDDALSAQLAALAKKRASTLKAYMNEQGIANKRLFLCKARYVEDGATGVAISME